MDIHEIQPVALETSPSAAGQLYPRASGRNLGQRALEIWRGAGQQTGHTLIAQTPVIQTPVIQAPIIQTPIIQTPIVPIVKSGTILPVDDKKLKRQVNYEVHFFRVDGTLGLRLFTVASTDAEALSSVAKMQCAEFVAIKVWRGLDHAMVHNRPADPDSRNG